MARFCEGLEEREARPLSAEERARVEGARRSWGGTAAARAVLVPGTLLATIPIAAAAGVLPKPAAEAVGSIAILLALLAGFPAALLWTLDALRARRRLGRDLAGGDALVFGAGGELVVLPHSGRVLERRGAPRDLSERAVVGDAAPPPADAPTYGVSLEDASVGDVRAHGWVRRPLAAEERDELRRLAALLRRPPFRLAVMTAIFGALGSRIVAAADHDTSGAVLLAVGFLLLAGGWTRWVRGRSLAGRLLADAAEGWIVRATAGELAGTEVLPGSGAHWTQAGAPAAWRLRASRRKG